MIWVSKHEDLRVRTVTNRYDGTFIFVGIPVVIFCVCSLVCERIFCHFSASSMSLFFSGGLFVADTAGVVSTYGYLASGEIVLSLWSWLSRWIFLTQSRAVTKSPLLPLEPQLSHKLQRWISRFYMYHHIMERNCKEISIQIMWSHDVLEMWLIIIQDKSHDVLWPISPF